MTGMLKKLSRIIEAFDNRMNILVGFALNGLLLWDLHCVNKLNRLRLLQSRILEGNNILFILDEILKGTNSEDKRIGSKLFLRKLIGQKGTGLIATHDTSLGTIQEEFPGLIINKCIEIEIDGEIILFDYLLRDGITTRRNAVLLMKQMEILEKRNKAINKCVYYLLLLIGYENTVHFNFPVLFQPRSIKSG